MKPSGLRNAAYTSSDMIMIFIFYPRRARRAKHLKAKVYRKSVRIFLPASRISDVRGKTSTQSENS